MVECPDWDAKGFFYEMHELVGECGERVVVACGGQACKGVCV